MKTFWYPSYFWYPPQAVKKSLQLALSIHESNISRMEASVLLSNALIRCLCVYRLIFLIWNV